MIKLFTWVNYRNWTALYFGVVVAMLSTAICQYNTIQKVLYIINSMHQIGTTDSRIVSLTQEEAKLLTSKVSQIAGPYYGITFCIVCLAGITMIWVFGIYIISKMHNNKH